MGANREQKFRVVPTRVNIMFLFSLLLKNGCLENLTKKN